MDRTRTASVPAKECVRALLKQFLLFVYAISMCRAEIPAGTRLLARLSTAVASDHSKPGDAVHAVLIAPVKTTEGILPAGGKLSGTVVEAKRRTRNQRRPMLRLRFDAFEFEGNTAGISATVVAVDNARETVDAEGRIYGIKPTGLRPGHLEKIAILATVWHPPALAAMEGAKFLLAKAKKTQIRYGPGIELTVETNAPIQVAASVSREHPEPEASDELRELVNRMPVRVTTQKLLRPGDITNLMFVGSENAIQNAFGKAGWTTSEHVCFKSLTKMTFAVMRHRPYRKGPMSTMLLEGRKPDLIFQKQNNTFAKRHHIRIWKVDEKFEGQPVWVAAATHDIGISFSFVGRGFTHMVDAFIDREREKVVTDLTFAGSVKTTGVYERPGAPKLAYTTAGHDLQSDGGMAVLMLRD